MPADLKLVLGTVLKSKGSKKFNFLYATGKRKDGKGDGVLIVSPRKLKKDELTETCEVKETLDGVCWASPNGDVTYFKGKSKKLSTMLLAKMMLSVRKETGKGYEFALPPDGVKEPGEDVSDRQGEPGKENEQDETPSTKRTTSSESGTPKAPPDPAVTYKKRLEEVLRLYQQTIQAQPNQQAVLEKSLKRAMNHGKEGNYLDAITGFKHLEQVMTKLATAPQQQPTRTETAPSETAHSETAPPQPEDLAAAFKEEAGAVTAMYVHFLKKVPDSKGSLEPLAQKVAAAGKSRDYSAGLEHCTALRKALRAAEDKQVTGGGPSRVVLAKSRDAYEMARLQARAEITRLRDAILADPETKDDERYGEIKSAVARLPKLLDGLDDRLIAALDVAYRATTPSERVEEAGKAHEVVLDYLNAINRNALLKEIDAKTGYGTFKIYDPLVKLLKNLADHLKV